MFRLPHAGLLLAGLIAASARGDSLVEPDAFDVRPAWLIELPPSVHNVLVADTENATLHHYVHTRGRLIEKDRPYMSIGLNGVGKERAWDRRTPLGVYFITERLDTTRLADKYGVAAFPLDYPNAWDRHQGRTGDGIWLHGVDHNNPERPPRDTDGCLALPNDALLDMADALDPLTTPVIVSRRAQFTSGQEIEALRAALRNSLEAWRSSQVDGDLPAYLDLYAPEFRYRGLDRDAWAAFRLQTFASRPIAGLHIEDLLLVADPETPGLFLSRFRQVLATDTGPVSTVKRLYWQRRDGNLFEIVAEDAG